MLDRARPLGARRLNQLRVGITNRKLPIKAMLLHKSVCPYGTLVNPQNAARSLLGLGVVPHLLMGFGKLQA
ncbi:hypothetical protein MACH17_06080 [Phaeobacter inhibens]|nr:hypothetical protein MACH17_06080 [Phaeobacter inhibens]